MFSNETLPKATEVLQQFFIAFSQCIGMIQTDKEIAYLKAEL